MSQKSEGVEVALPAAHAANHLNQQDTSRAKLFGASKQFLGEATTFHGEETTSQQCCVQG